MAVKSCIKIKPITGWSEAHNFRNVSPKYLIEPSNKNVSISNKKIDEVRANIERKYFASVGRKMHSKSTPIREAVVLLPDDNNKINKKCLTILTDELEKKYGIRAFQWHIHNDEGHITDNGEPKYNYHAHILFDWTDKKTGKSIKLNRQDMSDIQTLTAEIMGMERGVKGSKNLSLNHHQFRGYLEIKERLEKKLKHKLTQEEQREIREQIKQQDYGNKTKDQKRHKKQRNKEESPKRSTSQRI